MVVAAMDMRIMNFENAPPGAEISVPAIFNGSFNVLLLVHKITNQLLIIFE